MTPAEPPWLGMSEGVTATLQLQLGLTAQHEHTESHSRDFSVVLCKQIKGKEAKKHFMILELCENNSSIFKLELFLPVSFSFFRNENKMLKIPAVSNRGGGKDQKNSLNTTPIEIF